MNPALNKQLHGLLNKTGLSDQKASLVISYTAGRSDSSRELSNQEAKNMIDYLQSKANEHGDASQKMRRKIISMAHELHWHGPLTPEGGKQQVDMQRLNNWCLHNSSLKKELNKYTYQELPALVSQFTIMYNKYLHKI